MATKRKDPFGDYRHSNWTQSNIDRLWKEATQPRKEQANAGQDLHCKSHSNKEG